MSCQEFDWKAYALDDISGAERKRYDTHLLECASCREESERLGATLLLVKRLPATEPPRRIAFVSDPVFEPSWWQRLWASGPRLAFLGSGMLAAAIVAHGVMLRPAAAPVPVATARVDEAKIQAEVDRRVSESMGKVVADLRTQQGEASAQLAAQLDKKWAMQRNQDLRTLDTEFTYLQKQLGALYKNASLMGGD